MVPRVTEQRTTPRPSIEPFLMAIAANTVLPTTVVTSNGKTQTFSEDRIPSLTDLTTTTKVTTTLSENEIQTATSTTTLIPVIFPVTKGGFIGRQCRSQLPRSSPSPPFPTFLPFPRHLVSSWEICSLVTVLQTTTRRHRQHTLPAVRITLAAAATVVIYGPKQTARPRARVPPRM